eukprot:scaffold477_cov355-Pinguiococcus_pyrenoidosus.AAC.11
MTTQYQTQALKGVALFADKGERPVNAKVRVIASVCSRDSQLSDAQLAAQAGDNGDVEVFWETLTDDLRAEPAGSVCFSVKDAPKGIEVSATRKGPNGDALSQPLENEDDLIRSFTELLNKKFPIG